MITFSVESAYQAVIRSFSDARASHAAGGVYELEPQSPNEKDADE